MKVLIIKKEGIFGSTIDRTFLYDESIDPIQLYKDYMLMRAKELDIVISKKWLDMADYENNHKHLTKEEFKLKRNEYYTKYKNKKHFFEFLKEDLKLQEINFEIYG